MGKLVAYAPNGKMIIGTADIIYATAVGQVTKEHEAAEVHIGYTGDTVQKEQFVMRKDDERVFVAEGNTLWRESDLVWKSVEEAYDDDTR
ncbi:MAG: hypothetical protein HGA45_41780 [Chloroflexales bacterium]|nr:hypothetical protein [Chloroflexales bacterium]